MLIGDKKIELVLTRTIKVGNMEYFLTKTEEGWRDSEGTLWGISDPKFMTDPISRCGVGAFSFNEANPLNVQCGPHDNKYSNPVYQEYHNRSEADSDLYRNLREGGASVLEAGTMWLTTRLIGRFFWENFRTR